MSSIKLVLADVDGTLVTHEKILTKRAQEGVRALGAAGIAFAITSGRPPRGMTMLIEPLALQTPIAAFNGGLFVDAKLQILEQRVLPRKVVEQAMEIIQKHDLDVWIYRGSDWFVHDRHGPHVDREEWTVKFPPTVLADYSAVLDDV
ncbi:MAG TPA: HAD hydrolase family protein, partial [Chthoniobacteraceae bacterium]